MTPYDTIFSLLRKGKKIQAIKAYRETFPSIGLKEAKQAVDMAEAAMSAQNDNVARARVILKQLEEVNRSAPFDLIIEDRINDLITDITEYIAERQ